MCLDFRTTVQGELSWLVCMLPNEFMALHVSIMTQIRCLFWEYQQMNDFCLNLTLNLNVSIRD